MLTLKPGDTVDRYVIEEVIGRGGMGCVYRAQDSRLHREVALTTLLAPSEGELSDETSVHVFDVGELDGTPYIAMELIVGQTLTSLVADDHFAWVDAKARLNAAIAKFPNDAELFFQLGGASFLIDPATAGPPLDAALATDPNFALVSPNAVKLRYEIDLDLWIGVFLKAEQQARDLEWAAEPRLAENDHAFAARRLVDTYAETGRIKEAGQIAAAYLDKREAQRSSPRRRSKRRGRRGSRERWGSSKSLTAVTAKARTLALSCPK